MQYQNPDGTKLADNIHQFKINKYLMDDYNEFKRNPDNRLISWIGHEALHTDYIGLTTSVYVTRIKELRYYTKNLSDATKAHLIITGYWSAWGWLPKFIRQILNKRLYARIDKTIQNIQNN